MGTLIRSLLGGAASAFGGLFGGFWGYIAAGAMAALGAWYVTHGLDDRAYKALQLADANRVIAQERADAKALAAFQERSVAANLAAQMAAQEARRASQDQAIKLQDELSAEEKKNAPLARCMDTKLPDGVLDSLPR